MAAAPTPNKGRSGVDPPAVDEAGERFGVAHHGGAGDRARPRGAGVGRRGPDDGHFVLAQAASLVRPSRSCMSGGAGHGVDHEAVGRAGGGADVLDGFDDAAVARGHHERLARAGEHGGHGRQVVDGQRRVFGQAHRHDEVEVWAARSASAAISSMSAMRTRRRRPESGVAVVAGSPSRCRTT